MNDRGSITGHVIQYTRVRSSDPITINVTSGTTHTISGLTANVEYSVKVATVNTSGTGAFSDPVVQASGVATYVRMYLNTYVLTNARHSQK